MHSVGVDLHYSVRCQLTRPAEIVQYCIMRKDNSIVESSIFREEVLFFFPLFLFLIYSSIATGFFQIRVAVAYAGRKAHLIGFQSIREIEMTNVFQFYALERKINFKLECKCRTVDIQ